MGGVGAMTKKNGVLEADELLWDALMQGGFVSTVREHGIVTTPNGCTRETLIVDTECISTWEDICAYFARRGMLKNINGRLYRVVKGQ
jgi:hypothetical protein